MSGLDEINGTEKFKESLNTQNNNSDYLNKVSGLNAINNTQEYKDEIAKSNAKVKEKEQAPASYINGEQIRKYTKDKYKEIQYSDDSVYLDENKGQTLTEYIKEVEKFVDNMQDDIRDMLNSINTITGAEILQTPKIDNFVALFDELKTDATNLGDNINASLEAVKAYANSTWYQTLGSNAMMLLSTSLSAVFGAVEIVTDAMVSLICGMEGIDFDASEYVKNQWSRTFIDAYFDSNMGKMGTMADATDGANDLIIVEKFAMYIGIGILTGGGSTVSQLAATFGLGYLNGMGTGTENALLEGKDWNEALNSGYKQAAKEALIAVATFAGTKYISSKLSSETSSISDLQSKYDTAKGELDDLMNSVDSHNPNINSAIETKIAEVDAIKSEIAESGFKLSNTGKVEQQTYYKGKLGKDKLVDSVDDLDEAKPILKNTSVENYDDATSQGAESSKNPVTKNKGSEAEKLTIETEKTKNVSTEETVIENPQEKTPIVEKKYTTNEPKGLNKDSSSLTSETEKINNVTSDTKLTEEIQKKPVFEQKYTEVLNTHQSGTGALKKLSDVNQGNGEAITFGNGKAFNTSEAKGGSGAPDTLEKVLQETGTGVTDCDGHAFNAGELKQVVKTNVQTNETQVVQTNETQAVQATTSAQQSIKGKISDVWSKLKTTPGSPSAGAASGAAIGISNEIDNNNTSITNGDVNVGELSINENIGENTTITQTQSETTITQQGDIMSNQSAYSENNTSGTSGALGILPVSDEINRQQETINSNTSSTINNSDSSNILFTNEELINNQDTSNILSSNEELTNSDASSNILFSNEDVINNENIINSEDIINNDEILIDNSSKQNTITQDPSDVVVPSQPADLSQIQEEPLQASHTSTSSGYSSGYSNNSGTTETHIETPVVESTPTETQPVESIIEDTNDESIVDETQKVTQIPKIETANKSKSSAAGVVVPVAAGLSAAAAAGIGAKAYLDRKKNNDNDEEDYDESDYNDLEYESDYNDGIVKPQDLSEYEDDQIEEHKPIDNTFVEAMQEDEEYDENNTNDVYEGFEETEKYGARTNDELADME